MSCAGSSPTKTSSLAPGQLIGMDKLVDALQYLGYSPTSSQLQELKSRLTIEPNNKVGILYLLVTRPISCNLLQVNILNSQFLSPTYRSLRPSLKISKCYISFYSNIPIPPQGAIL